jgi:hypothetical protein
VVVRAILVAHLAVMLLRRRLVVLMMLGRRLVVLTMVGRRLVVVVVAARVTLLLVVLGRRLALAAALLVGLAAVSRAVVRGLLRRAEQHLTGSEGCAEQRIRHLIPLPHHIERTIYGKDVMDLTIFGLRSM